MRRFSCDLSTDIESLWQCCGAYNWYSEWRLRYRLVWCSLKMAIVKCQGLAGKHSGITCHGSTPSFALKFQYGTLKTLQKGSLRFPVTHLRNIPTFQLHHAKFLDLQSVPCWMVLYTAGYHGVCVLPLVIHTRSHRKWTHLASNEITDNTTISEAERTHKLSAQWGEDTGV